MVCVIGIGKHRFEQIINGAEPLNDFHAIVRIDSKTHLAIIYKPTFEKA
jgi:hypothetical protein